MRKLICLKRKSSLTTPTTEVRWLSLGFNRKNKSCTKNRQTRGGRKSKDIKNGNDILAVTI